jgi:hypothetical protein
METVETFLQDYAENVRAVSLALRALVTEILPDAHEVVTGHKNISYSTDAGMMKGGIVYIGPFKDSVNLGFIDGVDLPDPRGLLKGTGKRLRHIKFKSVEEIDKLESELRSLLEHARSLKTST